MTLPLFEYVSIKNNYCIGYLGEDQSLILDVIKSRHFIEKAFPELQVFIVCKDEMHNLVINNKNIILESNIPKFTGKIAYFRNLEEKDDLIKLLEESNIKTGA